MAVSRASCWLLAGRTAALRPPRLRGPPVTAEQQRSALGDQDRGSVPNLRGGQGLRRCCESASPTVTREASVSKSITTPSGAGCSRLWV